MKRLITALAVIVIIIVITVFWWNYAQAPVDSKNKNSKSFVITSGDGVREIAKKLHDQGLIKDQIVFFLLVKQMGIEKQIQAGSFKLSPSMTASELAKTLTVGTEDIWITIPEGWRSEQILEYLTEKGMGQGDINVWKEQEGKYFPETYLIPKTWDQEKVRNHLLETFEKKFDAKMRADAKAGNLTVDQVVNLASIIEREAGSAEDMPIVAGILLNRLNDDHALQTDATIHYMLGNSKNNWWPKKVLSEDLKIPSPYNTYLNPGLPPTPIGNPGLVALKSVIYPQKSDYFFYISDKQGNMHYAKTLEEHNANIAKYLR